MHTGKCTTCRQFKQRSQAIEKLQQSLCRPSLPSLAASLRCNMSLLALFDSRGGSPFLSLLEEKRTSARSAKMTFATHSDTVRPSIAALRKALFDYVVGGCEQGRGEEATARRANSRSLRMPIT